MQPRPAAPPAVLKVAVDTPLRQVFDYLHGPGPVARAGARVRVSFGRRQVVGFVVGAAEDSELPGTRLKPVQAVLDAEPLWDPVTFELLRWASDYYHQPLGEVLATAVPGPIRDGRPAVEVERGWRLTETGAAALAGPGRLGPKQRLLLERLRAGAAAQEELAAGMGSATLRASARRGLIVPAELAAAPLVAPPATATPPALTPAQAAAVGAVGDATAGFVPWLLHGITGSGKTEVYLRIIADVLARGRSALVLVPEIALTPQLLDRFRARLAAPVVALHSSMADGERLAAWRAARDGRARVVVGTRSAIFTPLPALGLVVVDEEHDASYKQQDGFRYSARDLAVARAQRARVAVILGSATPSLESLDNARAGRYRRLDLPERAGRAGRPRIARVDLRIHAAHDGLAQPSLAAIERHLAADGQTLVFLNRRGYAPTLYCTNCNWIAPCPACDARLTVHLKQARLVCHHCGHDERMPFGCPTCGGEVRPVGQGTERVEQLLADTFPGMPIVRVDRDVIRRRGEIEAAFARVRSGEARILVGTQMLTKGHDFPNVTLVVVLNADQGLFGADFRASERLAQQLVQVAGRAGRGDRPGEVLVQTAFPEHPLIASLLEQGYEAFALRALEERARAGWPPYARLALLRAEGAERNAVFAFLRAAAELAAPRAEGVRLLGPAAAVMERRAGRHRAHLLLEAATRAPLQRLLGPWLDAIAALPDARRVRWSIDVDPLEID